MHAAHHASRALLFFESCVLAAGGPIVVRWPRRPFFMFGDFLPDVRATARTTGTARATRVDSALFSRTRAVQSHRSSAAPPVLAARHRRATKGVAPCGRVVVVGDAQSALWRVYGAC
jgi:hypothetical protein